MLWRVRLAASPSHNLMDIAPADQNGFDITATAPGNPARVEVARIRSA
jgi:hypothetical protein